MRNKRIMQKTFILWDPAISRMAMAHEAWPNAPNVQIFNIKMGFISLGVYFRGVLFPWGFISYLKLGGGFSVGVYFLDPTYAKL